MNDEIITSVDQTIKASFAEYVDLLEKDLNMSKSVTTRVHQQINEAVMLQEQLNAIKVQQVD